ncbi:hypothetical protein PV703_15415, partial [Streptomyces sp. ME01-24h]|nr:hypothetical protein [Streptomyces sp. ME01-24h]
MRPPLRAAATLAVAAALLTGCGSGDDWSRPHPRPSAVGTPGPGFVARGHQGDAVALGGVDP